MSPNTSQLPAGKVCPHCENKVGIVALEINWEITYFGERHEVRKEICPACLARWTLDVKTCVQWRDTNDFWRHAR